MSLPAYLDYAATTPVDPRVAAVMADCLTQDGAFGNPGSLSHDYGDASRALVEAARSQVATAVGAAPADVVWTSGATEANNLALFGTAYHQRDSGRHIVTVRTEHKAVLDPCRELERRGWSVTYLVPGRSGLLDPTQVQEALRPDTVLVSVMHVNNEIGVIQDIGAIAAACAAHGSVRLHVDAAQSVGKCALDFDGLGLDLLSLSAHKSYGPKGVGALVVSRRRGVQLQAQQFGGGQERNLRSGTVATHQVVGMGAAFALSAAARAGEVPRIALLRDRLWQGLEMLGGALRNGDAARSVAHLLNVSFENVEGESLLAAVRPSIAVSTGSACTSAVQEPSYVLRALGRDDRLAESSLRFSLGRFSTQKDVDTALGALEHALSRLRRIGGCEGSGARLGDRSGTPASAGPGLPAGTGLSDAHGTMPSAGLGLPAGIGLSDAHGTMPSAGPGLPAGIGLSDAHGKMPSAGPGLPATPSVSDALGTTDALGTAAAGWAAPTYNDLTRHHFETAACAGVMDGKHARRGAAGSREQGTWVQFEPQTGSDRQSDTLQAVRFLAFGCPHVIAVCDWLAQYAVGLEARPVLPEGVAELRLRFALPIEKLGRLLIIEDAWIAALSPPSKP